MLKQMVALMALMVSSIAFARDQEYVIVVHGGMGAVARLEEDPVRLTQHYTTLNSASMIGDKVLSVGDGGPEAVTAAINYFEGNPLLSAGIGATYTVEGTFKLDASIMEGKDLNADAVTGLKHVKHPINAAYTVKTKSPHVMLNGAGAEEFAKEQGLEMVEDNMYFAMPRTMEWIEKLKQESKKNGAIGYVVLDKQGNLATGTNTGSMFKKRWGRIDDSPVIRAGAYAGNNNRAVSCTGHSECFIHHTVAPDVCARYKYLKESIEKAADYITHAELNTNAGDGDLTAVDKLGNIAIPYNSSGMFHGFLYKEKDSPEIKRGYGTGKKIVVVGEK